MKSCYNEWVSRYSASHTQNIATCIALPAIYLRIPMTILFYGGNVFFKTPLRYMFLFGYKDLNAVPIYEQVKSATLNGNWAYPEHLLGT